MGKQIIFHHYQQLSKTDLAEAVQSYRKDLHPNETKSCIILLSELRKLIEDAETTHGKGKVEGLRIYFYRADPMKKYKDPNEKILEVNGKTQMSIMLVPMTEYKGDAPRFAKDMFDDKGNIWVLTPGGEHTGLCPTNCGGSI